MRHHNIILTYIVYEALTLLAAVVVGIYLKAELRSKASLTREWRWIATAMVLQLVGETIYDRDSHRIAGDFWMHTLSGGIICLGLFYYLAQTFQAQFRSWRLELIAFFMFVSTFGVLNELMEYALDTLNIGRPLSPDRLDTWRDLTANTVGSLLFWVILRAVWRRGQR